MSKYDVFIQAIHQIKLVNVVVDTIEKGIITRTCVPFDYGPSRRNLSPNPDRYHFYDLDSPDGVHTLSILPEQLISIETTSQSFNPAEYVIWTPNWFIPRDWGIYS